jgi:hypothetical protein
MSLWRFVSEAMAERSTLATHPPPLSPISGNSPCFRLAQVDSSFKRSVCVAVAVCVVQIAASCARAIAGGRRWLLVLKPVKIKRE